MTSAPAPEHIDFLILGAGLSGIGTAHHVRQRHPERSVALLEARDAMGGTWDLFRYPGVRSDSDMHTLGFAFRPWSDSTALADGPSILEYLKDTAREDGTDRLIKYGHRAVAASFSSETGLWTVDVERDDDTIQLTTNFLFNATGYYRYDRGYTPDFPGRDRFAGEVIHPQFWPDDFDPAGKRIVVIGSGATAVTLVPALAGECEHVTMLQRSPTYIASVPGEDPLARRLAKLPKSISYPIVRWKNVALQLAVYNASQRWPERMKRFFIGQVRKQVPAGFDVDRHFTPKYNPWDQRLCAVPRGDLFRAIRNEQASVVTDRIATFTEDGIELESGETLQADVIVTATGLDLRTFSDLEFTVDGERIHIPDAVAYKAMMLSDVPNFAFAIGYTNSSWTLKVDLVGRYVCRLLSHLDKTGTTIATPHFADATEKVPLLDFSAGYVLRKLDTIPQQGTKTPWRITMNYPVDRAALLYGKIDGPEMEFSSPTGAGRAPRTETAAAAA